MTAVGTVWPCSIVSAFALHGVSVVSTIRRSANAGFAEAEMKVSISSLRIRRWASKNLHWIAAARPVGPEFDLRKALRLHRIGHQPRGDQLLERGALVAFADGGGPIGLQKAIEWSHREKPNS